MAQRFGRRRKRALEQRIKDLEIQAFGPAGRCPDDIPSIDDLPMRAKYLRIEDDPRRGYDASAEVVVLLHNHEVTDRIYHIHRDCRPIQMGGRCWVTTNIDMPYPRGRIEPMEVTMHLKQITPPVRRRW